MASLKLPRTRESFFAYAVIYYRDGRPIHRGIYSEQSPTVLRGERTRCVAKMTSRRGFGEAQAALARKLGWSLR